MPRASRLLASSLLIALAAQAQEGGLLSGFTIRFHGGLDHMAGLSDLNDQIRQMNEYFGTNGTWVSDAQGENFDFGWAPYLKIASIQNRPDMGITVERTMLSGARSRLIIGAEYTAGAASTSNLFEFTPGTGTLASAFAEEKVDVASMMATCRYSLKDVNLPLHVHVGLGVGMAEIEALGRYLQEQDSPYQADPMYGLRVPMQTIIANYDGSALEGRLFMGAEMEIGPLSVLLDLGYNHMDFGDLDGTTVQEFRGEDGVMDELAATGAPDTRYEFAPLISASLQYVRDNAIREAMGLPPNTDPIDLTDPELHWGTPQAISYDLSGGYARLSIGYRF